MNKLIALAVCAAAFSAFAESKPNPSSVALRYVAANEAFQGLQEHFGAEAASAVTTVDPRLNSITLNGGHPQAEKIRAFLAGLDVRPAMVRVDAVITRHVDATATQEARDVVLARPSAFTREGERIIFSVPGPDGTKTNIELRVHSLPAQK
jgi:hypothetical protein